MTQYFYQWFKASLSNKGSDKCHTIDIVQISINVSSTPLMGDVDIVNFRYENGIAWTSAFTTFVRHTVAIPVCIVEYLK